MTIFRPMSYRRRKSWFRGGVCFLRPAAPFLFAPCRLPALKVYALPGLPGLVGQPTHLGG